MEQEPGRAASSKRRFAQPLNHARTALRPKNPGCTTRKQIVIIINLGSQPASEPRPQRVMRFFCRIGRPSPALPAAAVVGRLAPRAAAGYSSSLARAIIPFAAVGRSVIKVPVGRSASHRGGVRASAAGCVRWRAGGLPRRGESRRSHLITNGVFSPRERREGG